MTHVISKILTRLQDEYGLTIDPIDDHMAKTYDHRRVIGNYEPAPNEVMESEKEQAAQRKKTKTRELR